MHDSPYDHIGYRSDPIAASHPDRLATVAHLFGMEPAPVSATQARILELGCGNGISTIAMASGLPAAEIVAIDSSRRQIDEAQTRADAMELTNLTLVQQDLADFPQDAGRFDYILAHGLYSWVSRPLRDRMLEICQQHLKANGVAYISYNTYPGWNLKAPVRELLLFHARDVEEPEQRIQRAGELLEWVTESLPPSLRVYRSLFENIQESVVDERRGASYLFHDLMSAELTPVLFQDFAAHACRFGLRYLAEADVYKMHDARLSHEMQQQVFRWSEDLVAAQQYLDLLVGRSFRKSLLCREAVTSHNDVQPERMKELHLASQITCQHPRRSLGSDEALEFSTHDNVKGSTRHPLTKAAWLVLSEQWPRPVSFAELVRKAAARLAANGVSNDGDSDRDEQELCRALTRMLLLGSLDAYRDPPHFVPEVGDRPVVNPCARLQAGEGQSLANVFQRPVVVDSIQRELVPLLDGSRDRMTLLRDWALAVIREGVPIEAEEDVEVTADDIMASLERRLDGDLEAMASAALLVG